jgi:Skp family chaperone for outer membrane proteins
MDLEIIIVVSLLVLFKAILLTLVACVKLKRLVLKFPQYEQIGLYKNSRVQLHRIDDKLKAKFRSMRSKLTNGEQSELSKLHQKLKESNLENCLSNVFESDRINIISHVANPNE